MVLIATTTVTIARPATDADPYVPATPATFAAAVPSHVSAPSGADLAVGGHKEVVTAVALLPAGTGIEPADQLTDDATGIAYRVAWCRPRQGLGLDHEVAGLLAVRGGADG